MSELELLSPRRSSRNHASSIALDIQATIKDDMERTSTPAPTTSSKSESVKSMKTSRQTRKSVEKRTPATKRKTKGIESNKRGRKKAKKESSDESSEEEDEEGEEGGRVEVKDENEEEEEEGEEELEVHTPLKTPSSHHKKKNNENKEKEMTVKELIEKRMRLTPTATDFSVSRLIGAATGGLLPPEISGVPDESALQLPPSCLFAQDALGRVNVIVSPDTSQFNVNGVKYLPLTCLMDDEGFTVALGDPVTFTTQAGKKVTLSLAEALKMTGIAVKRRMVGRELLGLLRHAGIIVHWEFVAKLEQTPNVKGKDSNCNGNSYSAQDSTPTSESSTCVGTPTSSSTITSLDPVKRALAELSDSKYNRLGVTDRRRSLENALLLQQQLSALQSGNSSSAAALNALAAVACFKRDTLPLNAQSHNGTLKISDPSDLNRFIGLIGGQAKDAPSSPLGSQQNSDPVPDLSLTKKILLISDFDAGMTEVEIAEKYNIALDKIPSITRLRVPYLREETRLILERKMRQTAMPVRRTNFVGLNIMMWRFFKDCRERNIGLTGKQLKEHAMFIANQLGLQNFKGSEGWLDAFKRRHKIDLRTMTGEPVNYEADEEGNIVCMNGEEEDESCYVSGSGENSPGGGATDALLAQVTAMANVVNEHPLGNDVLQTDDLGPSGMISCDDGLLPGSSNGEAGLIAQIVKSTAIRVPDKELSFAFDTIRAFVVQNDPSAMSLFYELQSRLANVMLQNAPLTAPCADADGSAAALVNLLNGGGSVNGGTGEIEDMDETTVEGADEDIEEPKQNGEESSSSDDS